jgi:hypothetical protein
MEFAPQYFLIIFVGSFLILLGVVAHGAHQQWIAMRQVVRQFMARRSPRKPSLARLSDLERAAESLRGTLLARVD